MWDAPLTLLGYEQARAAATEFQALPRVDLALTSPLTRAARTCLLALPMSGSTRARIYEVCPIMAEHLEASCDIGRTPDELRLDFPELNFQGLPDVWWYVPEEHAAGITPNKSRGLFKDDGRREPRSSFCVRVDAFARLLASREEATIAAFAHADFFHEFLVRYMSTRDSKFKDYWMKNCEVVALEFASAADLQPPVELAQAVQSEAATQVEEPPVKTGTPAGVSAGLQRLRREVQAQHPELKGGQLNRTVSLKWKELSLEERADYMKQ